MATVLDFDVPSNTYCENCDVCRINAGDKYCDGCVTAMLDDLLKDYE